jgi:hypothetical protein
MPGRKFIFVATLVATIAILVRFFWSDSEETKQQLHQGRNQTVLFMSNAEHGLANVLLATSHALLIHHSAIELHYASFSPFRKHVSTISETGLLQSSASSPITFHELKGPTYWQELNSQGLSVREMMHAPGFSSSAVLGEILPKFLAPWNGSQYFSLYEQISRIIDEVDPALIAVDMMLGPALDATKDKKRRFAILSPNTLTDVAARFQPRGSLFWKYPA